MTDLNSQVVTGDTQRICSEVDFASFAFSENNLFVQIQSFF